jgi:hypothetical protein
LLGSWPGLLCEAKILKGRLAGAVFGCRLGQLTVAALWDCVAGVGLAGPAWADGIEPADFIHDTTLYFTAPLRWDSTDWMYFAGGRPVLNGQDRRRTDDYLPALGLLGGTLLVAEVAD